MTTRESVKPLGFGSLVPLITSSQSRAKCSRRKEFLLHSGRLGNSRTRHSSSHRSKASLNSSPRSAPARPPRLSNLYSTVRTASPCMAHRSTALATPGEQQGRATRLARLVSLARASRGSSSAGTGSLVVHRAWARSLDTFLVSSHAATSEWSVLAPSLLTRARLFAELRALLKVRGDPTAEQWR